MNPIVELVCPHCGTYFEISTRDFWVTSGGTEVSCPNCDKKMVLSVVPIELWKKVMPIDPETGELEL